jgi:hypothetical protein
LPSKKKKEKVITVRMDEDSFKIVEDYAGARGLSISAYINSILQSYTEWFIPLASNEKVTIPKKGLHSLFSYASKESLDDLVKEWTIEQKHVIRLLGTEYDLESVLDYVSKLCKYMMDTYAVINRIPEQNTIWVVIRHNMGENHSYFLNQMLTNLFGLLQDPVDIITEYDETMISIRLKEKSVLLI